MSDSSVKISIVLCDKFEVVYQTVWEEIFPSFVFTAIDQSKLQLSQELIKGIVKFRWFAVHLDLQVTCIVENRFNSLLLVPKIRMLSSLGTGFNAVLTLLATRSVLLRRADDFLEAGSVFGWDFSHGLKMGVEELRLFYNNGVDSLYVFALSLEELL